MEIADAPKTYPQYGQWATHPSHFFYTQADGSRTVYNTLDGKQRLESLILFVGNRRDDMRVSNVEHYFYGKPARKELNFAIQVGDEEQTFRELGDDFVRKFKDYAISTIEIDFEDASLDDLVKLFVDINQEGVKVNRFDVVKALGKDPLFKQVFSLIATKQLKKHSSYLKIAVGSFSYVLGHLNVIKKLSDENSQVNRMWAHY